MNQNFRTSAATNAFKVKKLYILAENVGYEQSFLVCLRPWFSSLAPPKSKKFKKKKKSENRHHGAHLF